MKYIYTLVLILGFLNVGLAQPQNEYGEKFPFDAKNEKDPHFVLKDNYNNYLLTVMDVYGLMAGHQMIVRKFDQKNTLVETYKYDFPKIDESSVFKYLGFADNQNGKIAVFIETHSGKAGKMEIHKLEFDKASAAFTSTMLYTGPIVSLSKFGEIYLEKSDNGQYVAINYHQYRDKAAPDKNLLLMISGASLNVSWQKDLSFENEFTSQNFTVTNSGKVVLVRDMKGSKKGITYLVAVSANAQEDKTFDEQIFLNEMKSLSIGPEDYIIALNSNSKNFRSDYYNNLLLYDLKSGKTLNNNKISVYSSVKNLYSVSIRNVVMQNNEMHIFTEAKAEQEAPRATSSSAFSMPKFETKYNFGPAYVFVIGFDGQLKTTKNIYTTQGSEADLFQSFGLANVKGEYYINTGNQTGIYKLVGNSFDKGDNVVNFYSGDRYGNTSNRFINQLFSYFPDKNSFLLGRVINPNQMSLVSVTGVN